MSSNSLRGWLGKRRKQGGRRARVTVAKASSCMSELARSGSGRATDSWLYMQVQEGRVFHCALATQGCATHPVMDVSTSCISGTIRVRLLSCSDSERSTLPLQGKRGRTPVSTSSRQHAAGLHIRALSPHSPRADCTLFSVSSVFSPCTESQ